MNNVRREQLANLAAKVLNEDGQEDVQNHLDDDEEQKAVEYILGAVDRLYKDGLDEETVAEYYSILGVSPDRASTIRQASGKL